MGRFKPPMGNVYELLLNTVDNPDESGALLIQHASADKDATVQRCGILK